MIIGVPKEVKDHEARVGIVPSGVKALVEARHQVMVETKAGELSSMPDSEYRQAGAEIVSSAAEVWKRADMIVKVKEPIEKEIPFFRDGLVLFTYLHLAPIPDLTDQLLKKKVTGIAYETVTDRTGLCHCSRPCQKSPDVCPSRWAPAILSMKRADAASCWAASPELRRRRSRLSAEASSASMRQRSRWEWALTPPSSTSISTACVSLTTSSMDACARSPQIRTQSGNHASKPTW